MRELTDKNFAQIEEAPLSLVMFMADWAGPCNLVKPHFEKAAQRYGNQMTFGMFDLDDNPETPQKYGVKQVPVFYLMRNGVPEVIKAGAIPENVLIDMCEEAIDA